MANQKISELASATTPLAGTELAEIVQGGINKKVAVSELGGATSELGRVWSTELLFDKKEVSYELKVMDSDITFTLAPTGNVSNSLAAAKQIIQADGVHAIYFGEGFQFIEGMTSGQVLEAGTYPILFLYDPSFGTVIVNVIGSTSESSAATQLSAPSGFMAAADGENDIDLSWSDVANESSYLIEVSLDGSTAWTTLTSPAAGATSYTHSGLSAGDLRYYRIKAVGDGVSYLDSTYSSVSATTEDAGDVTAPVPTFSPVSGNTTADVNQAIVITLNEEIRNTDGSPIVSDQAGIITVKQTNSGGADIGHSWTIDVTKTIITIIPDTAWGATQLVYVAINNIEDVSGNEVTVEISSTFTTTEYTAFNGTSNFVLYGDTLDSLFTPDNTYFELEAVIKDYNGIGSQRLFGKYAEGGGNICFYATTIGADLQFAFFGSNGFQRRIRWTGPLDSGEHKVEFHYDGSIDTNNGRDRVSLYIDDVLFTTGKALDITTGTLIGTLKSTTAQLTVGSLASNTGVPSGGYFSGRMKEFYVRSAGPTDEIEVPVLKTGTDTSGNARNGTWV